MDSLLPPPGTFPAFDFIYEELNETQKKHERKLDYINIWSANSFLDKIIKKGVTYKQLANAWQKEFSSSIATPYYLKQVISLKRIAKKILKTKRR